MEIGGFYKEVIQKLNANKVEFLLVGGLAVGFHGYARFTGDMDLWINPTSQNLDRLGVALEALKYSKEVVSQILTARPVDHPTPIRLFSEDDRFKVDLMTTIYHEPLTFSTCASRAVQNNLGDFTLPVIGLRDLIEIKSNVKRYDGGMKDLVDAQELRKILERDKTIVIDKRPSFLRRIFKKGGKDKDF